MSRPAPSAIPMSQIIASDAPLLSPIADDSWDHLAYGGSDTALDYYNIPPSPPHSIGSTSTDSSVPTARMLKMHMGSDCGSDSEQLCLPTHQLFDFPEATSISSSSSPAPGSPKPPRLSITINSQTVPPQKRAGPGPESGMTKKPRASGERIRTKDFVPPDVSGLSKREARLVKNRAAAFLSRQRKREEFETMEARVAALEQENARLLALTQTGSTSTRPPETEVISALEKLRAQLVAAEERERELSAKLAGKSAARDAATVKMDPTEPQSPLSRSTSVQSPHKSAASLGLMVLLCALPSLVSMPTHSTLSTSTPFSGSASSLLAGSSLSTFDFNTLIPSEYEWSRNSGGAALMDLDTPSTTTGRTRKLEFVDDGALRALSGLDISFDTSPSDDGKIRVRIHSPDLGDTPSSYGSFEPSPSPAVWTSAGPIHSLDTAITSDSFGSSIDSMSTCTRTVLGDPFLGVGASSSSNAFAGHYTALPMPMYGDGGDLSSSVDFGSSFSSGVHGLGKRRVRIALKSLPAAGGEGGEWEVQFC